MGPRDTAEARLRRILHILPAASREGGASIAVLAEQLGVTPARIRRDVEEVTARAFYHHAGLGDELQVHMTADRVKVWSKGGFRRPVRLSPREALALELGLRVVGAQRAEGDGGAGFGSEDPDRPLAAYLRQELAVRNVDPSGHGEGAAGEGDGGWATGAGWASGAEIPDPAGTRARLFQAVRGATPCTIRYLKASADEPEARTIEPYAMVHAEGAWYVLAWCRSHQGVRAFRVDRILSAELCPGSFVVPDDFNPAEYVDGGRVYRGGSEVEVMVRYSAQVARWIAERFEVEPDGDGAVTVTHRVADPHWVVEHVLRYGGEAVVTSPADVRAMVVEAAGRVGGAA